MNTTNHAPTVQQLLLAAEALLMQAGHEPIVISTEDLQAQLSLNRGISYDLGAIAEVAYGLFDTDDSDIGKYRITRKWLLSFNRFLDSGLAPL